MSAFSHASIYIHTIALSEPLYVFFSLLSLGMLASHIRRPSWRLLVGAALLCGAGVLTRYAGWAMVPAGAVCLVLLPRRPISARLRDATVFVRGRLRAAVRLVDPQPDRARQRDEPRDGVAPGRAACTCATARGPRGTGWWRESVVHPLLTGAAAIVAAAIFVLPLVLSRRGEHDRDDDALDHTLPAVMVDFLARVRGAADRFDLAVRLPHAGRPADPLAGLRRVGDRRRVPARRGEPPRGDAVRATAWLLALMLATVSIGRGARLAHEQFRDGSGFAHRQWRESRDAGDAEGARPARQWVYTNAPGAMYLLTGRPSIIALPSKFSASSMRENPKYPGQLRRMQDDVHSGRAVVCYLRRYARGRQRYNPSEQELGGATRVHRAARGNDGTIFHRSDDAGVDDRTPSTSAPASAPSAPAPNPGISTTPPGDPSPSERSALPACRRRRTTISVRGAAPLRRSLRRARRGGCVRTRRRRRPSPSAATSVVVAPAGNACSSVRRHARVVLDVDHELEHLGDREHRQDQEEPGRQVRRPRDPAVGPRQVRAEQHVADGRAPC